ncbi:hypothetical protein [Nitrogeniibacter aestuarii]|uniref:hypothetical protein n=1 Tax=Nitrogeniibacter aestuarii TaxID=2815343 RepID=UPI001E2A20ED|nr:hypothetical protein [Nitrogeniibacter aestuarii]
MGLFSKTRIAKFWGAGDSQICCSGVDCEDNEFTTYNHPNMRSEGHVATFSISSGDDAQGLFIHVHYTGHWSFAVSPSNVDIDELPDWEITREWGTVNSHSETLSIECPKAAKASVVERVVEE